MKYFSTGFYVSNSTSLAEIFNECFSWVNDSPHTTFIPAQLVCDYKSEEYFIESKNERIDIITYKNKDTSLGCFRYSKISEPHKWVTDISINKNLKTDTMWIQVESSVVSQDAAYLAPQPKKPLVVMRLIDKFPGGLDDIFKVSVEPHSLDDTDEHLNIAAKVINGETDNRLPIIYVSSKYFFNEHAHNIIPERLARKVCGLAHVLIEPSNRLFSIKLKNETNAKNAYAGAVGIYWPRGQNISFYRRGEKTAKEFEDELFDDVVRATTTMAPVSDSGWSEIQTRKTKDSINSLKERGEYTRELMALYEADNVAKDDQIEDLKHKISSLEHRVRTLQSQASAQGSIALNAGEETDFFDGEIKNIIIDALKTAIKNKNEFGRSYHILSSLIANNEYNKETESRRKLLKRTLTGYRSMDSATQRNLKDLGFSASSDGKHWKLTYNEDPRYSYILPKTGSDHRGSLNAISDIANIIF
ncbi:hypothetical protein ACSGV2_001941 [Escherichia coli]